MASASVSPFTGLSAISSPSRPIFGFASLEGPTQTGGSISRFFTPAFLAVSLVLPIALLEILVYTNKFVGPMVNFRHRFQQLADGEMPDEIQFRSDDLLKDFDENFNLVRARLQEHQSPCDIADDQHVPV